MIRSHRLLLAATYTLLLAQGCATPHRARMNPSQPIETTSGYTQDGRDIDPESMVEQLSRESAAAPHVKRAKPLGLTAYLLAAAGGALAGWPFGQLAGGAENPNWNLAYAGAGALAVAIPLSIWAALSMKKAIDAHNALVTTESRLPVVVSKAPPRIVQHGSLLSTEVDLRGITLTWLGLTGTTPKLALRFQRVSSTPDQAQCQKLALRVDSRDLMPPTTYKAEPQGAQVRETVQTELALDVLKRITGSGETTFTFCGRSRRLTADATDHGARFLQKYQELTSNAEADTASPDPNPQVQTGDAAPAASEAALP